MTNFFLKPEKKIQSRWVRRLIFTRHFLPRNKNHQTTQNQSSFLLAICSEEGSHRPLHWLGIRWKPRHCQKTTFSHTNDSHSYHTQFFQFFPAHNERNLVQGIQLQTIFLWDLNTLPCTETVVRSRKTFPAMTLLWSKHNARCTKEGHTSAFTHARTCSKTEIGLLNPTQQKHASS